LKVNPQEHYPIKKLQKSDYPPPEELALTEDAGLKD